MDRKHLLYLVSSDPLVSPFDINMAYDAGFDAVIPYAGVTASAVSGLTQDIIFSRGPKGVRFSAMFLCGSDVRVAEAMLHAAKGALFDPFRIGLMIDPKGGYTTAAAILAKSAALRRAQGKDGLAGARGTVLAGTGGVGRTAAAMAAAEGAEVTLTSRRLDAAESVVRDLYEREGVRVTACSAPSEVEAVAAAARADIILATGAAGVRLLSATALRGSKIVADVNAVPPAGIEGLAPPDDGKEIHPGIFGIGALAIGILKNRVEASLLKDLLAAEQPLIIDRAAARRRASDLLAAV